MFYVKFKADNLLCSMQSVVALFFLSSQSFIEPRNKCLDPCRSTALLKLDVLWFTNFFYDHFKRLNYM